MRLWALAVAAISLPAAVSAQVYVQGYTKKDGTYVAPHYRSNPDSNPFNNYSTKGNVNPYTGQPGTKNPYGSSGSYGSSSNPYSNPYSSTNQSSGSNTQTCIYYSPC